MPHREGAAREQPIRLNLEETIQADNPVRVIDADGRRQPGPGRLRLQPCRAGRTTGESKWMVELKG